MTIGAPSHDAGPVCCQVTVNLTDDPHWQYCRYGCYPDTPVTLRNIPWVCNLGNPTTCDDSSCVVGVTCQGFNGTGLVVSCDADPVSTSPQSASGSFCP